jgi:hypothetical protein
VMVSCATKAARELSESLAVGTEQVPSAGLGACQDAATSWLASHWL